MLDGGPARTSQLAQRRAAMQRAEPVRRQPEPTQPAPEPVAAPRTPMSGGAPVSRSAPRGSKKPLIGVIVVLSILLAGLIGWYLLDQSKSATSLVDQDKYQAVFFTNGQVYFGKLESANHSYFTLNDVFYIQSDTTTEGEGETAGAEASAEQKLIKRGAEVYGPEDPMVIERSQVMFFENIKTDSEVAKLIQDYKSGNQ